MNKFTLLIAICIASCFRMSGQIYTWIYTHHPPTPNMVGGIIALQELPDNGAVAMYKDFNVATSQGQHELFQVDGQGNLLWQLNIPDAYWNNTSTCTIGNDKVLMMGDRGEYLLVNTSGTLLRFDTLPAPSSHYDVVYDPAHGIATGGHQLVGANTQPRFLLLDTNFTPLLDTVYTQYPDSFLATDFFQLSDGNFLLCGRYGNAPATPQSRVMKIAPDGSLLWTQTYSYLTDPRSIQPAEPSPGDLYLFVNTNFSDPYNIEPNILKIDALGDTLWMKQPPAPRIYGEPVPLGNGEFAVPIVEYPVLFTPEYSLSAVDTNGNEVWRRTIPDIDIRRAKVTENGVMTVYSQVASGNSAWGSIVQLDSNGLLQANLVSGLVFADTVADCLPDSVEPGFLNQIVLLEPDSLYAVTDSSGRYYLDSDSSEHFISLPNPPMLWKVACPANPDSHAVYFPAYYDTITNLHFALEPDILCPLVTASIATPFLRPCSVSTYTLEVKNMGTLPATNAYVDVIFDSLVTVTGMSCPFTNIGPDSFRVQLGTLPVFGAATCSIDVLVSCDPSGVTGRTSCAKARAYPDLNCELPNSLWDSSSVRVTGACQNGDSVAFVVENVGTMDMQAATGIVIAEDDLLRSTGTVLLNAGQDTVFKLPANGSTWTLLADQVPFHPGNSFPRATVEACGLNSMGQFSVGHVTSLMYDDQDPWVDIHCQEITNAFDPNDKRGWPMGTGELNYILDTDPIEYMIRFQNTGTDTAFTVVIRDQLPPELDLGSLQLGLASHPYSFRFLADNRLEWTFANILLPDSATNESASHGYVTFHVQQVPGNAPGTAIKNAADIYFDFNAAIVTDTSLHTVQDSVKGVLSLDAEEPVVLMPGVVAYPNPFGESVTVRLDKPVAGSLALKLYDLQGRLLRQERGTDNRSVRLDREGLPTGMYVYRLESKGKQIYCGKLLAN